MSAESVVREAGMLERYHVARHHLRMYTCIVISAKYAGTDGAVLDRPSLFSALEKVVLRHGALCIRLSRESTGRPVYVRLKKIDLSQVVEFSDHGDLLQVVGSQLTRFFDTDVPLPLWRLQVLPDGTVVFACHHAIGDGQSGLAFHHSLISALNNVERQAAAEPSVVSIPDDISLISPVEQLTSLTITPWKLVRELFNLVVPTSWTTLNLAWTGHPVPATESLATEVRLLQYSPGETSRILELCRKHHSTLTSILHTLATVIISQLLAADPSSAGKYRHTSTHIPISLRPLTGTSRDEMCDHVSTLHQYPPLITRMSGENSSWFDGFPWDVAAGLTTTLRSCSMQPVDHDIGLLRFNSNYEGYLQSMLGRKRSDTLEISNVGRCQFTQSGLDEESSARWNITDMYFAQAQPSSGAAIHINVVGTPAGGLGFTITWGKDAIDEAFGESFCSALKEGLKEMIDEEAAD